MDDVSKELKAFLDYAVGRKSDDVFVRKLEEAVEEAKRNREWRHEYMTLLMRDQENVEKGKIYGAITTYRELDLSEDEILKKLEIRFQLTEKEANEYLQNAE